jgi:hypothetical protein
MGTYKNDYNKNEDVCLWEIHEIRNQLHKEIKKETFEEINNKAKILFAEMKNKFCSTLSTR